MTSLSRRLISAVCAVTLATSLVPIPAFAEPPSGGVQLKANLSQYFFRLRHLYLKRVSYLLLRSTKTDLLF